MQNTDQTIHLPSQIFLIAPVNRFTKRRFNGWWYKLKKEEDTNAA